MQVIINTIFQKSIFMFFELSILCFFKITVLVETINDLCSTYRANAVRFTEPTYYSSILLKRS